MAARPQVNVYNAKTGAVEGTTALPAVFSAPIRRDIVQDVHTRMAKNARQAYGVNVEAGMQHSAESWGTGRAVSRIPRISGSGTHRSGQAAFGNMCRQGRMFAPTKVWRRWHRKISVNQRRYATVSALAASAVPALVQARGHVIEAVPEIPLVLAGLQDVNKAAAALAVLAAVGAAADVEKVKDSKKLRAGVGKARNRRYVQRRGPLVCLFNEPAEVVRAFRNLPGVEVANVERLNLLQLAPGGHMGRFIVWSQAAFDHLNAVFGTATQASEQKSGYTLPAPSLTNADIGRIINSAEVQGALRAKKTATKYVRHKKNPLRNLGAMIKLNPAAAKHRREEIKASAARAEAKAAKRQPSKERKQQSKKFYAGLVSDEYAF